MQTAVKKVASSCFCPGPGTGSESRLFKGEVSVSISATPHTHKNLEACLTLLTFCEDKPAAVNCGNSDLQAERKHLKPRRTLE